MVMSRCPFCYSLSPFLVTCEYEWKVSSIEASSLCDECSLAALNTSFCISDKPDLGSSEVGATGYNKGERSSFSGLSSSGVSIYG